MSTAATTTNAMASKGPEHSADAERRKTKLFPNYRVVFRTAAFIKLQAQKNADAFLRTTKYKH